MALIGVTGVQVRWRRSAYRRQWQATLLGATFVDVWASSSDDIDRGYWRRGRTTYRGKRLQTLRQAALLGATFIDVWASSDVRH
jgi:hypothetical protein